MEPIYTPPSFTNEDEVDDNMYEMNIKKLMGNLDNSNKKNKNPEKENLFILNNNNVLITNLDSKVKNSKLQTKVKSPLVKGKLEKINNNFKEDNKNIIITAPSINTNLIDNFEKNLKKENFEYNFEKLHDSDYDEDLINEDVDALTDKNEIINRFRIIQEKLKEKNKQIKTLQKSLEEIKKANNDFMDIISKDGNAELKDKKLIELAKKNRDLKLIIEKLKLKEKELMNKINEIKPDNNNGEINQIPNNYKASKKTSSNNNNNILLPLPLPSEEELRKKIKTTENKIVEMRNKLQNVKEENTKLNILIKREIGESIDIDKALKDKVYWKGRAEAIESLKTKIKILESQIESLNNNRDREVNNNNRDSSFTMNDKSSLKSNQLPITNFVSYNDYKKEKELLKSEIEKIKEENLKYSTEYSRVKSRIQVLEKELKQQKDDLTNKIKILIEKSDNDEKLILALNKELEKRGKGFNPSMLGYENPIFNLQQEINKLRLEIKEKDNFINNLNSVIMPDQQNNGWDLQTLSKIIGKLKDLEDENKKLKFESDDGKIYESLARDNAKLRLRIKDLEDKLLN